jgi:hypothetical protein
LTIKDVFYAIPFFALSIAAAVFEGYQRNYNYSNYGKDVYQKFNQGKNNYIFSILKILINLNQILRRLCSWIILWLSGFLSLCWSCYNFN